MLKLLPPQENRDKGRRRRGCGSSSQEKEAAGITRQRTSALNPLLSAIPCLTSPLLLVMELTDIRYNPVEYIETAQGNKVCRKSVLCGSQNIMLHGKTIIQSDCIIRGDLA